MRSTRDQLATRFNEVFAGGKKSKAKYKKGDRIVVNRGNDEYYVGTVTSCGGKGKLVYFKLDSGESDSLSSRSKHIMGVTTRKAGCKTPIHQNDLPSWLGY